MHGNQSGTENCPTAQVSRSFEDDDDFSLMIRFFSSDDVTQLHKNSSRKGVASSKYEWKEE
jgi:hypothetical protein